MAFVLPQFKPHRNDLKEVKNIVYKAHPELRTSSLGADSLKEEIEKAVFEGWLALDSD